MQIYFISATTNLEKQVTPELLKFGIDLTKEHTLQWGHKIYVWTRDSGVIYTRVKKYLVFKKLPYNQTHYDKVPPIASIEIQQDGEGLDTIYTVKRVTVSNKRENIFYKKVLSMCKMPAPINTNSINRWNAHVLISPELNQIFVVVENSKIHTKFVYPIDSDGCYSLGELAQRLGKEEYEPEYCP